MHFIQVLSKKGLNPAARRQLVIQIRQGHESSEKRACGLIRSSVINCGRIAETMPQPMKRDKKPRSALDFPTRHWGCEEDLPPGW